MRSSEDLLDFLNHRPVCPEPKPYESFPGYITRVGELSGISRLPHLEFNLQTGYLGRTTNNLPRGNYGRLMQKLMLSEQQLLMTTFHYLAEKFHCSPQPPIRLLDGVRVSNLRYCPQCIAEKGYYSLLWSLNIVPGCLDHHIYLLDTCPHCKQLLPLFGSPLKIGVCSFCGGNLTEASPSVLSQSDLFITQVRCADLHYLLQPQQHSYELTVQEKLAGLRELHDISIGDIARDLCLRRQVVQQFERSHLLLTLNRHIDYADYLGVSIRQVLAYREHSLELPLDELKAIRNVCKLRKAELLSIAKDFESRLLEEVKVAVATLRASGISDSQIEIAKLIGVTVPQMVLYPTVKQYLQEIEEQRPQARNRIRIAEITAATDQLTQRGEPTSGVRISAVVGYRAVKGLYDKEVDEVLATAQAHARQMILVHDPTSGERSWQEKSLIRARLRELLCPTEECEEFLRRTEIYKQIGVTPTSLKRIPGIMELLDTYEAQRLAHWNKNMLNLVENAWNYLNDTKQRITPGAFATQLGMHSSTKLKRFPKLWQRVQELVAISRAEREEALLKAVQSAVREFRNTSYQFSLEDIGRKAGTTPRVLKYYPSVFAYLNTLPELPIPLAKPKWCIDDPSTKL